VCEWGDRGGVGGGSYISGFLPILARFSIFYQHHIDEDSLKLR